MIRTIFWKEWHEHRSKYLSYWFAINAPLLLVALGIAVSAAARVPFADLSNATVAKYLPLSLIECLLVVTFLLLLTGYLAVATFSPEIENRSLFFVYEQPLPRMQYLSVKLLYGACHVVLATCFAILLFPVVAYVMMLLSGKVTVAGSGATFALVMAAAARAAVWCSLISVGAFTVSAVISALLTRWWLAAACSVILTALLVYFGSDYFNFFPDTTETMSVGMSLSTGNSQWVTISRALTKAEIGSFGHWRLWPLLTALLLTAACCAATALIYQRKELK